MNTHQGQPLFSPRRAALLLLCLLGGALATGCTHKIESAIRISQWIQAASAEKPLTVRSMVSVEMPSKAKCDQTAATVHDLLGQYLEVGKYECVREGMNSYLRVAAYLPLGNEAALQSSHSLLAYLVEDLGEEGLTLSPSVDRDGLAALSAQARQSFQTGVNAKDLLLAFGLDNDLDHEVKTTLCSVHVDGTAVPMCGDMPLRAQGQADVVVSRVMTDAIVAEGGAPFWVARLNRREH